MSVNRDELYSMSLDDGRIVYRNRQVDNQINYYPVPESVVKAIYAKEVDWRTVKDACEKKMKEKGDLSIQDYLYKLKLLNVRKKKNVAPVEKSAEVDDRSDEMISIADVIPAKKKPSKSVVIDLPKASDTPAVVNI